MMNAKRTVYNRILKQYEDEPVYGGAEMSTAQSTAKRAKAELTKCKATVARLEREIREAENTRELTGKLDDGTPVSATLRGQAMCQLADSLTPMTRYRVSGEGANVKGLLRLRMTAAVPDDTGEPPELFSGQSAAQ
jgi:hypothetical protein